MTATQESAKSFDEAQFLPALFASANRAAIRMQHHHFIVIRLEFGLLIGGALLGTLASNNILPIEAAGLAAIVLSVSVIASWVGRTRRFEKLWFDCRAVAETARSMAWRYMARVQPYVGEAVSKDVDAQFGRDLQALLVARREIGAAIAAHAASSSQISPDMRKIRGSDQQGRRDFYIKNRLRPELAWYQERASRNASQEMRWFIVTVAVQLLAVVAAICLALTQAKINSPISLLTAIAAAAIGWTRAKRFVDLSQAYGLASQELATQDSMSVHIANDEDYSRWVQEVEETISREHTMWQARRNS